MKIDFDAVLLDLKGEIMKDGDAPVSLKTVAVNALFAPFPDEREIDGTEKAKRFNLGLRIDVGGEVEVSAEEVSLVKKLIGKAYPVLIVGRAYQLIEA